MISQDKYHDIIPTQNEYYLKIFKAAVSELWIYRGMAAFSKLYIKETLEYVYIYMYIYNIYV